MEDPMMDEEQPFGGQQAEAFAGEQQKGTENRGSRIPLVLLAAAVLAIGYIVLAVLPAAREEGARNADLERIRREYLERTPVALCMSDPGRYEEERRALFKWYVNALTDHGNKFPGSFEPKRFEKELAKKGPSEKPLYEKRYSLLRDFWDMMAAGKYMPVFTAFDQGIRFDIYRLETGTLDGEPSVKLHFALYGIQRQWTEDQQSGGGRVFKMRVNSRFEQFNVDGRDASGKPKVSMSLGSGEPFNVNHPERFIEEFPPSMVVGYYEIPRIPDVAASVEMTFSIGTRSVVSGQETQGSFVWKMDEMPAELKLPSGQEWKNAEKRIVESSDDKR